MPRKEEELTGKIIDSIINVHRALGPGFDHEVYLRALMIDLKRHELATEANKELVVIYEGEEVGRMTLDLIVEGRVIVSLHGVDELQKQDHARLRSCLRMSGIEVGLLCNFSGDRADFRRIE